MAREFCADCGKPREPESAAYSYCIECSRRRQREKYREGRKAAGQVVRPRVIDADERRTFLLANQDKPGGCESCGGHEPVALVLEHYSTSHPPDPNDFAGNPFALWCSECHKTAQSLTLEQLHRAAQVLQSLTRFKVEHGAVLKDLDWPVTASTPTKVEQKRPNDGDLQSTPGATI